MDRYGYKIPYAISFVFWCLASAATGLAADSIAGLTATRLAVGAGEAVMMPASYRWIRNNFAEDAKRARGWNFHDRHQGGSGDRPVDTPAI